MGKLTQLIAVVAIIASTLTGCHSHNSGGSGSYYPNHHSRPDYHPDYNDRPDYNADSHGGHGGAWNSHHSGNGDSNVRPDYHRK